MSGRADATLAAIAEGLADVCDARGCFALPDLVRRLHWFVGHPARLHTDPEAVTAYTLRRAGYAASTNAPGVWCLRDAGWDAVGAARATGDRSAACGQGGAAGTGTRPDAVSRGADGAPAASGARGVLADAPTPEGATGPGIGAGVSGYKAGGWA